MEIHKTLDHPNIVKVLEIIEAPLYSYTCIVMEYVPGMDLLDYMQSRDDGSLSFKSANKIMTAILSALDYLHSQGVAVRTSFSSLSHFLAFLTPRQHRDLKLENVMISDEDRSIKIIDFGFANTFSSSTLFTTPCGSACYACPEIFKRIEYDGAASDVWSLGVIYYGRCSIFSFLFFLA
jgi:serine/threonine protein kinase